MALSTCMRRLILGNIDQHFFQPHYIITLLNNYLKNISRVVLMLHHRVKGTVKSTVKGTSTRFMRSLSKLKTIILAIGGTILLGLGIVGLALPFLPGILFLFCAAACFASLSPTLRKRLNRQPRMARFFSHVDAGARLDLPSRFKLAFWASLEAINPRQKDRWQRSRNNR